MTNVIQFPRSRNAFVRFVPSTRLPGYWEVQWFQAPKWRAASLYASRDEAATAAKALTERLAVDRLFVDGGQIPEFGFHDRDGNPA